MYKDFESFMKKSNTHSKKTPNEPIDSDESYLTYKLNKIENMLNIKITNEEEKYVYLVKKLNEYPQFVNKDQQNTSYFKSCILFFFL